MSDCRDDANDDDWELVRSIESPDLSSLLEGGGEFALDAILNDGLLKEVPVIGTLVGFAKAGRSIRDMLLLKKLLEFLRGVGRVAPEKRRAVLEEIKDPKKKARLGQNTLLLLDRIADIDKPRLMANAFRAFLERKINLGTLERLYHALDHLNVRLIGEMELVYGDDAAYRQLQEQAQYLPQSEERQQLALCGLMRFEFGSRDFPNPDRTFGGYGTSVLGKIFYDVVVHDRDCDLLRNGPDVYPE